jgi:TP901 family phage tail tape measure protein
MANAVSVGDLVVRLIADAKPLESALSKGSAEFRKFGNEADKANKQAQRSADATARGITTVVSRLTGMAAAFVSVNAIMGQFNRTMADTTALDHLSQVTGVSVERLSELRNVALATGVSFETVSRAFEQFGARMTEALASSTSKGSQALRALGVDVRDAQGNIRQLDDVLPELADKFSQFANGSNKAALAAAIFGEEAGPKMLALLNRGKEGLEELKRRLGSTFTSEDVQRARDYQETVAKLQIAFEKFFQEFVRAAGPTVIGILNKLTEALNSMKVPSTFREELANVNKQIEDLTQETVRLTLIVTKMESGTLVERLFGRTSPEQIREQLAKINKELADLVMRREVLSERVMGEFETTVTPERAQAPAMDPFLLEKAQIAVDQIMDRLSGQRDIFDSLNYSWQEYSQVVTEALKKIERAHDQQFRAEAQIHRIKATMRRQEQEGMLQTASAAASAISALWPKQKGAAIAAAIINTGVAITRALAGPPGPPWTFAIAALTAVQGAAQIAAIQSTNEDGSGGGGGSISAPPPAEPQADFGRSLTIQGVDPGSIFSGGQVRGLIEMINEEVRNGATLISSGRLSS